MAEPQAGTVGDQIDRACYRLLTDPDLRALVGWWESESLRAAMPPGPVDTSRLLMKQGDGERLLRIMQRASAHQARMATKEA
jgi:hypothetical protein